MLRSVLACRLRQRGGSYLAKASFPEYYQKVKVIQSHLWESMRLRDQLRSFPQVYTLTELPLGLG